MKWAVVALLWVVGLLNYLDRQVIFSVLPLVRRDLGLTDAQLGFIGAAFLWVYAFCSPVSGFLADRFGRKRVILVSLLVWSAITWWTGQVRSLPELLLARGLMGVSEACYLPAALAMIADYHDERTRSRATGLHYSGIYLGIVLGGATGGWLGERYGWRFAFLLFGGIGVVYTMLLALVLREGRRRDASEMKPAFFASAHEILAARGFGLLLASFAIASFGNWAVNTWMPLYLYERFHLSLSTAGFSATFYPQLGSLAGILGGRWLADFWNRRKPKGRAYTQALALLAAAPFLILVGASGTPALLFIGLAAFGMGRGTYDCNAMPVLCQIARPDLRSTGFGLLNLVGTFTGGAVAMAGGLLKDSIGLGGILQLAGVLLAVAAVLLRRLGRGMPSG